MSSTIFESFKTFMFSSNIAKTSAGYAIGAATADLAKTITFSMLIPIIQMAWAGATLRGAAQSAHDAMDFSLVAEHLLYWVCVIFVAYVLSELFLSQGLLGLKTTLDATDKGRLEVAEHEAKEAKGKVVDAAKSLVQGEQVESARYAPVV